jgi:hypothetical protein
MRSAATARPSKPIKSKYLDAVRDWGAKGARSDYLMDAKRLEARAPALDADDVAAAASFHLGTYLAQQGHAAVALVHFKRAHALRPVNWTYKRQAWTLGDIERDYGTTFHDALKDEASGPFYPLLDLVKGVWGSLTAWAHRRGISGSAGGRCARRVLDYGRRRDRGRSGGAAFGRPASRPPGRSVPTAVRLPARLRGR